MPNLDMDQNRIGGSNFSFSGARINDLGATEYTMATIAVDMTGSVIGFEKQLRQMLVTAIDACRKSPRSNNLLVRIILFSTGVGGVQELDGFTPLQEIDVNAYPNFNPSGGTPLYDAVYNAVGATVQYGADLTAGDFLCNGIVFIITDGDDNTSTATPRMIAEQVSDARKGEKLESLVTVLIGINAGEASTYLQSFQQQAQLDQYIDAGDATPQNLAKLAAFVSQSVSSQSQALGTGGASRNISATI